MTIRKNLNTMLSAALLLACVAGLSACQKQPTPETASGAGPAEKAGRQLDQAAEQARVDMNKVTQDAKDKMDKAGADASQSLSNATVKVGEKIERAGEKIQESAHEEKKN